MSVGFDPAGFWALTPRELETLYNGARKRLEREHDERAWLAWHTAALYRTKEMPRLDKLTIRRERSKTWEEQLAAVIAYDKRINAMQREMN